MLRLCHVTSVLFITQTKRMVWPSPRRASATDLLPSLRATHRFCRRSCNSRVARLTRFLGGCPRASASRAMWTRAVSFLRLSSKRYRDGWLWPICRANALFQASVSLFVRWVLETVAFKTFHVSGGNNGRCRRMRIRGADGSRLDGGQRIARQVPDTYVLSKYMPGRHEQTHIGHDWKPTIEWVVTFKNEHTIVVKTKDVFYVNIFHQNPGKM